MTKTMGAHFGRAIDAWGGWPGTSAEDVIFTRAFDLSERLNQRMLPPRLSKSKTGRSDGAVCGGLERMTADPRRGSGRGVSRVVLVLRHWRDGYIILWIAFPPTRSRRSRNRRVQGHHEHAEGVLGPAAVPIDFRGTSGDLVACLLRLMFSPWLLPFTSVWCWPRGGRGGSWRVVLGGSFSRARGSGLPGVASSGASTRRWRVSRASL